MAKLAWLRIVLSIIAGLAIGIVVTALVNLFAPISNLVWTVLAVCVSSIVSSLAGYLLGSGRRKEGGPTP